MSEMQRPISFGLVLRLLVVLALSLVAASVMISAPSALTAGTVVVACGLGLMLIGLAGAIREGKRRQSVMLGIILAVVWVLLTLAGGGLLLARVGSSMDWSVQSVTWKYWLLVPLAAVAVTYWVMILTRLNRPVRRWALLTAAALAFPLAWWLLAASAGSVAAALLRNAAINFLAAFSLFLLACVAIADTWRAFKAALPGRHLPVFVAYAALWALVLVVAGQYWTGMGGLYQYDMGKRSWQPVHLPAELQGEVEYVHSFADGRQLVVTDSAAHVGIREGDSWDFVGSQVDEWNSCCSRVYGLAPSGRLWLIGNRLLRWLDPDQGWGETTELPILPDQIVRQEIEGMALDGEQRPWVLTSQNLVYAWDFETGTWQEFDTWRQLVTSMTSAHTYVAFNTIATDSAGQILVAGTPGVFHLKSDGSWSQLSGRDGPNFSDLWTSEDGTLLGRSYGSLYTYDDAEGAWHYLGSLSSVLDRDGNWLFHEDGTMSRWTGQGEHEALADDEFVGMQNSLSLLSSAPRPLARDSGANSIYFQMPGRSLPEGTLPLARAAVVLALLAALAVPPVFTSLRREYMPERIAERAREIESQLARKPETILASLRGIADADRVTHEAWRQIAQGADLPDAPAWRGTVRAYLALLTATELKQEEAVRSFVDSIPEDEATMGGAETRALYRWLQDALAVKDTRAIVKLEKPTEHLLHLAGAEFQVADGSFRPVDPLVAQWLEASALRVCRRMVDYDAVATVEGKLASLAAALGQLTPIIQADAAPGSEYPEVRLSRQVVNRWRELIDQELRRVRGPVTLRASLASRTLPDQPEVTLSIVVENIGHVPAVAIAVGLRPSGDYELVGASPEGRVEWPIERLAAGARTHADFTVRPVSQPDMRVLYTLSYADEEGERKRAEYPDVVTLLSHEADFQAIPNPFIPGTPVEAREMFFGRVGALAFARENLVGTHQNNVLVFYGQRRIGKTSILKQLPAMLDGDRFLFVFLDLQGYADVSTASFLFDLADEIAFYTAQANLQPPPLDEAQFVQNPSGEFNRFIRELKPVLGAKTLVLMLDEFEALEVKVREGSVSPEVYELLRHHMQHSTHLAFIFAGTERLFELSKDYWSVLFNTALFYEVGFLDDKAASALITEPVKGHLKVDAQAVSRIVELTSGHAYYIQVICRHLVNHMNEERRSIATVSDVNDVLQATVDSATAPISYIYQEQASRQEQWILSALSELLTPGQPSAGVPQVHQLLQDSGHEISEQELLDSLTTLAQRKVLVESYMRGHYYRFTVDLVRLWILRNKPLERLVRA